MNLKRSFCLALALFLALPAAGLSASVSGQSYTLFTQFYKENIAFINDNDNRHLLPLVIASRQNEETADGRMIYELVGEALNVIINTDVTGDVIESCTITLTAPQGLEYGSAQYNDFAISGYHSYALLMAMHTDPDPARRYELVKDVVAGMAETDGAYTRQLGAYTLSCTRVQNTANLAFHNNRVQETPLPPMGEDMSPDGEEPLPDADSIGLL